MLENQELIPKTALDVLESVFGYEAFRGPQADVVDTVINGNDALVLMPTGGGKSLCYQVPALVRDGVGIIVSPLIALMQDQVQALRALGVNARYLNSTLSSDEVAQCKADMRAGALDMLYVAPERLLMPSTLSLLEQCNISLFAIDEAHCVSQWGHEFRPEYMGLSILHERFPDVPRIALTATADERTREEIAVNLGLTDAKRFISGFDRPNIFYSMSTPSSPRDHLWRFIEDQHDQDAGIVYCLSRKKVEDVAAFLRKKGRDALPYHAGLPSEQRANAQHRFIHEEGIIIVATIAFGMGIDKPDVRFVAHLSMPKSIEAYYQETGRAGRDGLPSNAWMAYSLQDIINMRSMMQQSDTNSQHRHTQNNKFEAMIGLGEQVSCRRRTLLTYLGEPSDQMTCGHCDNCQNPPETWNATEAAQKVLSCIYRTDQRFGVTYLIDVLRGKKNDRMETFGHEKLSTFGIGKDIDVATWRGIFRQLIARGILESDAEGHGSLVLTEKARPVLRGQETILLRKPDKARASGTKREVLSIDDTDQPLWEAMRSLRKSLSAKEDVPAFVIFNDRTLLDMLAKKPKTLSQMSDVAGVGDHKLERYGDAFLSVIGEHAS